MSRLSSLRDEPRRQPPLDKGKPEQSEEVKLPTAEQGAEPSPVQDEGKSNVELWEQVWARENLFAALKRVESTRSAQEGTEAHRE